LFHHDDPCLVVNFFCNFFTSYVYHDGLKPGNYITDKYIKLSAKVRKKERERERERERVKGTFRLQSYEQK